jgi:hypothetical protein
LCRLLITLYLPLPSLLRISGIAVIWIPLSDCMTLCYVEMEPTVAIDLKLGDLMSAVIRSMVHLCVVHGSVIVYFLLGPGPLAAAPGQHMTHLRVVTTWSPGGPVGTPNYSARKRARHQVTLTIILLHASPPGLHHPPPSFPSRPRAIDHNRSPFGRLVDVKAPSTSLDLQESTNRYRRDVNRHAP